ncbi:MAG: B12-binding domain-containing radical SAM protein [Fibrobacterota bacterium]
MSAKIVLTCDRTMASEYHGLLFLGFSACIPTGTIPDPLYYRLFCPRGAYSRDKRLIYAPYGLRKIEAALLNNGFSPADVHVCHPNFINDVVTEETQVVCISSNDPLGIGPATSTFVELWGGEGRMAQKLRQLLSSRQIQKHSPFVLLGGPGAWQFSVNPQKQQELGIDCALNGEGEISAPVIIKKIIAGKTAEISAAETGVYVPNEEIPDIKNPSITGLVEITRGCARSCNFCVPTVRKVRSRPLESICREIDVNIRGGNTGVLLHGEDILLYNSDGLRVNTDAVTELFKRVISRPGVQWAGASHAALSSVVQAPAAVESISTILGWRKKNTSSGFFQVGIETGSPSLMEKHMKGKVYPYSPQEWPDVVEEGMAILHNNSIVSSATLILGLPGESEDDIQATIDLIHRLSPYAGILVPLLFSSMETSRLEGSQSLTKDRLTQKHHELIARCWIHNLKWLPEIWKMYSCRSNFFLRNIISAAMKAGSPALNSKIRKYARKKGGITL